jgi:hypothetical protein
MPVPFSSIDAVLAARWAEAKIQPAAIDSDYQTECLSLLWSPASQARLSFFLK